MTEARYSRWSQDTVEPGDDPAGPRVLVVGDSWAGGLGYREGPGFGRQAAGLLEPSAVLDLSYSGRTVAEALARRTLIEEFRPDVALLSMGGTEGMVHPTDGLQRFIERHAPATWHGVAGLEPRAAFATDARKRRRQRAESATKLLVKRVLITVTGGSARVPLDETRRNAAELLTLLRSLDARVTVLGLPHADPTRFPGSEQSFLATNCVLEQLVADAGGTFVPVADRLDPRRDFLADRLHLNGAGHHRVAAILADATRRERVLP